METEMTKVSEQEQNFEREKDTVKG